MKTFKNFNGAFGVAALLLGAMAFTACSSDDIANVNPTFDGESVKTQFAINIPYAGQQGTRMGANETQESNHFLGMYDIKLIPMTTQATGASTGFPSILALEKLEAKPSDYNNETWNEDKGFRKIYNDVNVPVDTKYFLFYGAGRNTETAPSTADDRFTYGILNATVSGSNTSNISFALINAMGTGDAECTKLLTALKNVAGVDGWKTYATNATNTGKPLTELFNNFTKLNAGSANTVCATLQSLHDAVAVLTGTPDETTIANAIKTAIEGLEGFSYNTTTGLSTTLTYPNNINMPDGSAAVKYNNITNEFDKVEAAVLPTSPTVRMSDICYPASIYYFVNTDLAASNNSEVTWPANLTNWNSGFTGWNDAVSASTRTIALKKPIQYGVGKLKTIVACTLNSLEDSKGNMITVNATNGFPISAILIGGQPKKANWDFHPNDAVSTWTNVIYDRTMPTTTLSTKTSDANPNFTLALDNYKTTLAADEQQEIVNVVIELTNNTSADFYGADGQIIPKDGKFYLVAKLDPKDKTVTGVTKPSVFMQDYTTTAKLTITSLKGAYNVIPDLRASQMQLGLAVDLVWKAGIEFDITIGE